MSQYDCNDVKPQRRPADGAGDPCTCYLAQDHRGEHRCVCGARWPRTGRETSR